MEAVLVSVPAGFPAEPHAVVLLPHHLEHDGCGSLQQLLSLALAAGNFSSFLFQLLPSVAVYTPSGVNQNFQYCGHNFASLPNGIGFGGQVWICVHLVCMSLVRHGHWASSSIDYHSSYALQAPYMLLM